jgi:hypothetical protein
MSLRALRRYPALPGIPSAGPLNYGVWVIIPLARTNLVTNPSLETATTGYSGTGASIAQSSAQRYHGVYSLAITPSAGTNSDGAFFATVSLTTATPYAYSAKVLITGAGIGKKYALSVATTGGVDLAATTFIATGRWQWIRGIYGETSSTTRRIYLRKVNHNAASVFYWDGVQVESCSDGILSATTYIDGDQVGLLAGQSPAPYNWTGTPHASTSYRTILTRAGGYPVSLATYNFLLTGLIGLGMAVPNNVSIPYTVLDGARFQRTTKPPRTIVLPGRFQANTWSTYQRGISEMRQAFDRDLVPLQQPLVLMVEPQDDCGNAAGDFATVQAIYNGGLEGNDTNIPLEEAAPAFTMYMPFLLGGDNGATLSVQSSVSNANAILKRSATGVWSALGTGVAGGTVIAIARGFDGLYYVGGTFTSAGGVANTKFIASYNPTTDTWAAMGTGAGITGTQISNIVIAPNGNVWVTGNFTAMGGVAGADDIARWDGSAWNAVGVPSNVPVANILTSTFDGLGNFYHVTYTNSLVKKWDIGTSTWSTLGTVAGSGAVVRHVVRSPNGIALAIGGDFTTVNGVAAVDAALWNGTAWTALGTPPADIFAMMYGPDGVLYAGGSGGATSRLWKWTGASWIQIGTITGGATGIDKIGGVPTNGSFFPGAILTVGGSFTTVNGITFSDGFGIWNGTNLIPADVDLPGTATVQAMAGTPDGVLVIGYTTTGTATAAAVTTVSNTGPSAVWPRLVIKGPSSGTSRIYQVVNYTTGAGIYLNYTIKSGETAIFIFDPQNPQFFTTAPGYDDNGDLSYTILPGSTPSQFFLVPGNNAISFFSSASTVTATLSWPTRYNGTADLVN